MVTIAKFLHDDVYKNGLGQFDNNGGLHLRLMSALPTSGNITVANLVAQTALVAQTTLSNAPNNKEVILEADGSGGWQVKVVSKQLTALCTVGPAPYIVITDHGGPAVIVNGVSIVPVKVLMYTQETSGQGITIGASLIVPAFSFGFSAPV